MPTFIESIPPRFVAGTIWVGVLDGNGNAWNGSAFVAYTAVAEALGSYPATRIGSGDNRFSVSVPDDVAAGHSLYWHAQAGGSPAGNDPVCAITTVPAPTPIFFGAN